MVIALVIMNIITILLLCFTAVKLVYVSDRAKKFNRLRECTFSVGDKMITIRLTKQEVAGVKSCVSAYNYEHNTSELSLQELKIIK